MVGEAIGRAQVHVPCYPGRMSWVLTVSARNVMDVVYLGWTRYGALASSSHSPAAVAPGTPLGAPPSNTKHHGKHREMGLRRGLGLVQLRACCQTSSETKLRLSQDRLTPHTQLRLCVWADLVLLTPDCVKGRATFTVKWNLDVRQGPVPYNRQLRQLFCSSDATLPLDFHNVDVNDNLTPPHRTNNHGGRRGHLPAPSPRPSNSHL